MANYTVQYYKTNAKRSIASGTLAHGHRVQKAELMNSITQSAVPRTVILVLVFDTSGQCY